VRYRDKVFDERIFFIIILHLDFMSTCPVNLCHIHSFFGILIFYLKVEVDLMDIQEHPDSREKLENLYLVLRVRLDWMVLPVLGVSRENREILETVALKDIQLWTVFQDL
jgi:hypothetical protein